MGLFDVFKGDSAQAMTPKMALGASLLYMMSADGEMDNEEIGHLLSVLGGASPDYAIVAQKQAEPETKPAPAWAAPPQMSPIRARIHLVFIFVSLTVNNAPDCSRQAEPR